MSHDDTRRKTVGAEVSCGDVGGQGDRPAGGGDEVLGVGSGQGGEQPTQQLKHRGGVRANPERDRRIPSRVVSLTPEEREAHAALHYRKIAVLSQIKLHETNIQSLKEELVRVDREQDMWLIQFGVKYGVLDRVKLAMFDIEHGAVMLPESDELG